MRGKFIALFGLILILATLMTGCALNNGKTSDVSQDNDDDAGDNDADDDDDDDDQTVDDDGDDDDDQSDDDNDDDDDDDDDNGDDDDTPPPYEPPDGLQIVFFDVGQGDAALVRFPEGSTMLIDGGPNQEGRYEILPYLEDLNLTYLDIMVSTHPDADHCGGLDEVLDEIAVGELWENGQEKETYTWQEFDELVDELDIPRHTVHRDDYEVIDNCDVLVMNADEGWTDYNANSVVLSIVCDDAIALFTGDATEEAQADMIDEYGYDLGANIVKVPHHGSPDHDPDFAEYVEAEVAVISVGEDNTYGHPNAGVVSEWKAVGADVYRTDQDGRVVVTADDGLLKVETED